MSAFHVDLTVGDWAASFDQDDAAEPDADVYALDDLTASWTSDRQWWPSQPDPVAVTLSLWCPSALGRPDLLQGDLVTLTISAIGATPGRQPWLYFHGRVTDLDAEPMSTGLAFVLTAVEQRTELSEETIGLTPFTTSENWLERYARLKTVSALPLSNSLTADPAFTPALVARDVDARPTADVIEEIFVEASRWFQAGFHILGGSDAASVGPLERWARPIMCQLRDNVGVIRYAPGMIRSWVSTHAFVLSRPGGSGYVYRDPRPELSPTAKPDTGTPGACDDVYLVPARVVERDSIKWRQDKASNGNRVRLTGDFGGVTVDPGTGLAVRYPEVVRQVPELVADRGPVEKTRESTIDGEGHARANALMYLGDAYQASPRWTFDQVTIRVQELAPDDWPRLFPGRFGDDDPAAGRLLVITDIPAQWNLHDQPHFPGRLVGATVQINGGVIRATASVLHQVPHPIGSTLEGTNPTGAVSAADLAASPDFANATPADFADLAAVDLRLSRLTS